MSAAAPLLIGIDVGGTFTDLVALLPDKTLYWAKVPTSPENPAKAACAALDAIAGSVDLADVSAITHGTTVCTNAILERRLPRAGFITTRGFRDVLALGRTKRPNFYDLDWQKPAALIPRRYVAEVAERVSAEGAIERPLDETEVRAAADALKSEGAATVAIGFLNSYENPTHERRATAIAEEVFGRGRVTASAAISPEMKEYERFSTAAVNSVLLPVVGDYVEEIEQWLLERDFQGEFFVMQCNGGAMSSAAARAMPVHMLESGPAAGVLAAAQLARDTGIDKAMSLDVGGTTVKTCLIEGGEARESPEFEVGSSMTSASRLLRAGGYAVRVPCFEINEIGAGGGSVAAVDEAGVLKVGPRSAGAEPGPACYGAGGTEATLTDACLLLGYLGDGARDQGRFALNRERAIEAIRGQVAEPLGIDPIEAAFGVFEVANATMIRALRSISVERGRDPAEYTLIAFGGAGGIHAVALARELGMRNVLVPEAPGVFSALGMVGADIRKDRVSTLGRNLRRLAPEALNAAAQTLAEQVRSDVTAAGGSSASIDVDYFADLRYSGQTHELTVPLTIIGSDDATEALATDFEEMFFREFGYLGDRASIELVKVRARGRGARVQVDRKSAGTDDTAQSTERVWRDVYFGPDHGWARAEVIRKRSQLVNPHEGPLVLEEPSATVLVPPAATVELDDLGAIRITVAADPKVSGVSDHLEVMRHRLEAISDEMALTIVRTARSVTATEAHDFSTALCNAQGEKVVQGLGVLIHLGSVSSAVKAVADEFEHEFEEGDVFLLNDPYQGGTHLPDFILVRPIFSEGDLVGFAVTIAHQSDIGSAVPGGNATTATELFEEGLIIPPIRICRNNVPAREIVNLIARNVRAPDVVSGDLLAQISACRAGAEQLQDLCATYGRSHVVRTMDELVQYTERLTRAALKHLPSGTYHAIDWLDDDGTTDVPIRLEVSLSVEDGGVVADFAGSSAQVESGLNCVPSTTMAVLQFAVRCLLDVDIPDNSGIQRCIEMRLPPRSIVSPEHPAPVAGRGLTAFRIADVVLRALSEAAPDRIGAAGDGGLSALTFAGRRADGSYYLAIDTIGGANGARPNGDGLQGVSPAIGNIRNYPIEALEREFPIQITEYGFVDESGAGQFRGGNALKRAYRLTAEQATVFCRSDRRRFVPWGLNGGEDGRSSALFLTRNGQRTLLPTKVVLKLERGDQIELITASGAGWGPAAQRDRSAVVTDVADALVTEEDAIDRYGLDLDRPDVASPGPISRTTVPR